ncbi:MAG: phenylalanine--tRNA ligase subunit beta [Acidobacteriaceae bacterium]
MKFSIDWLKHISGYNGSASKLAELISAHVCEAEVKGGEEFENIIVAKVTKIEKHPKADRLRVVRLTDGVAEHYPVVCGAWNFEEGDIVPLALPGARIPHDQHDPEGKPFTLAKAVIRGVESQGMICSGKELGISEDGSGILKLAPTKELGQTFSANQTDQIEISVPANRPDLMGYLGVGLEISSLEGKPIKAFDQKILKPKGKFKIEISDKDDCPVYLAARLTNVKVGPSPQFIQKRLIASGLRPINNVVDITNYVMLELGQPMHAFDASKVSDKIVVRRAKAHEKLKTLDGVERELSHEVLVIADSEKALGLAGIMGGADSAIFGPTSEIILESANFSPVTIRKSGRSLGLRTDASLRFEKNLPLTFAAIALSRAAELLAEHANAKIVAVAEAGLSKHSQIKIGFDPEDINSLLGTELKPKEQINLLEKHGFKVTAKKPMTATVPVWRNDVKIWQDLAEEIVRSTGMDEVPMLQPAVFGSELLSNPLVDKQEAVADILTRLGWSEIYTYSFVSKSDLERSGFDLDNIIEVANPLSLDQQFLRPVLLINELKVAANNVNSAKHGAVFEIGATYLKTSDNKVNERLHLSMLEFGQEIDPGHLGACFKSLAKQFKVDVLIKQDQKQSAEIVSNNIHLGSLKVHEEKDFQAVALDVDFEEFCALFKEPTFSNLSKYPSKELDVAIVVDKAVTWSEIETWLQGKGKPLLKQFQLFDVYEGNRIPPNQKSLAFRLVYQAQDRTLTDAEASEVHENLIKSLTREFNAKLRG